jgi:hypothetical protein
MGTIWYMISVKENIKLELGKPSEDVSVSDILLMSGVEGLQIISEHHPLANYHDENGYSTLLRLRDALTLDKPLKGETMKDLDEVLEALASKHLIFLKNQSDDWVIRHRTFDGLTSEISDSDFDRLMGRWVQLNNALNKKQFEYRGYTIQPTDPCPPIPMRQFDWSYVHKDYDGPGDGRCGYAADPKACRDAVDELVEEYPELHE